MFNFNKKILNASEKALEMCKNQFEIIGDIAAHNQQKVLRAFIDQKISDMHFNATTGYGYNDSGREALDRVFSQIFDTEDSCVRHNFVSGTHALNVALFGVLRSDDKILSLTGSPYNTMHKTISYLKEFNIDFVHIDFFNNNKLDYEKIKSYLKNSKENFKALYIQRSPGYSFRESLTINDIKKLVEIARIFYPKTIIIVDNCYGEFVQKLEPTSVGADLIVGSLIKNPGGGIARTGGYISGKKNLIEMCACRLTTPGTGKDVGATLGLNRELFMGVFNAPQVVGEALKTVVFAAALCELLGYETMPKYSEIRSDIVQTVKLGSPGLLIAFCQGLQSASPIDSFVMPEPWDMPGYDHQIIMAAGAFTQGSSIELSADAPLSEPYAVWLQGGINFNSAKIGILSAASKMFEIEHK